jgi:hypothetical protein
MPIRSSDLREAEAVALAAAAVGAQASSRSS